MSARPAPPDCGLIRISKTIEELNELCAGHNHARWGLRYDGTQNSFGVASDQWQMVITLGKINEKSHTLCMAYGREGVTFCYERDTVTEEYMIVIKPRADLERVFLRTPRQTRLPHA